MRVFMFTLMRNTYFKLPNFHNGPSQLFKFSMSKHGKCPHILLLTEFCSKVVVEEGVLVITITTQLIKLVTLLDTFRF